MAIQPNSYRGFRVTLGDATGAQLAILVPDTYRVLHFASAADEATDWNVSNPTNPTWYVHSETTPATDYISFDHDATDGTLNVASGVLKLAIDGTDVLSMTATALTPTTTDVGALGTTALMWADLFVASGAVINFNNGNITLTHTAGLLTLGGGGLRLSSATGSGLGYATGAGGAVTQLTDRSTGVTLNTLTGTITTSTASLAAEAAATFTVTNSTAAIGDTVVVSIQSGSNGGNTDVFVSTVAAGSFALRVANNNAAAGTAETGAILINFAIIKAVSA